VRNGRHDGYNKLRDEGRRYIAHVMTSAESERARRAELVPRLQLSAAAGPQS
jgi:hypothetical protein